MDDLQFIPEPYRGMISDIEPDDLYIVQRLKAGGEPVRIRRIKGSTPASQANEIEVSMHGQPLCSIERWRGRDLRSLVLELARAHDHYVGSAITANPLR